MKLLYTTFFVASVALATFAQDVKPAASPSLTPDQHSATRDAQHKADTIDKQIKDLSLQFLQLQNQARSQLEQLSQQLAQAKAAVDAQIAKDQTSCGDDKAWRIDPETLACNAVPASAAPANAAAKPATKPPTPSPGRAAAPPTEQAKK